MFIKYFLILLIFNAGVLYGAEAGPFRIILDQYVLGIGRTRPWLSVTIVFSQKVSPEFYEKAFSLLQEKLKPNLTGSIKRDNNILFKLVDKSLTKEAIQIIVDEANKELSQPLVKIKEDINSQPIVQESPQDLLRKAIMNDSAEEIKKAVNVGAIVNFEDSSKAPLLHAFLSRKNKAAEALLNAGANPNITFQGIKLVHYFILSGQHRNALLLIKYGADYSGNVDAKQDAFNFVLNNFNGGFYRGGTWSGDVGSDILLEAFLKAGSDLNPFLATNDLSKNLWYQSVLNDLKVDIKHIPPISFFVKHGANVNQIFQENNGTSWTPLLMAIDDYFKKISTKAAYQYDTKIIDELIKLGANVNQTASPIKAGNLQSPISYTLLKGDSYTRSRIVQILLDKDGNWAGGIELFLQGGGDPNSTINTIENGTWTLLGFSVNKQDVQAVKALLKAGGLPNNFNEPYPGRRVGFDEHASLRGRRFNSLAHALNKHNSEIIELLIQYGGVS